MAVALDSSAVIGFLDRGDALHEPADRRIRELVLDAQDLFASIVTYAEVLTGARLGHHDEAVVRGFFDDLIAEIGPIEIDVAERAAELRGEARSLRMPDAMILASADLHPPVDRILCADGAAERVGELLGCEIELLRSNGGN